MTNKSKVKPEKLKNGVKKQFLSLSYKSPHIKIPSNAKAVIYSKGIKHVAYLSDGDDHGGPSLTNSIEYAVVELSKLLGNHPEDVTVLQLNYEKDIYDLVTFKDGDPIWNKFDNTKLLTSMKVWLNLTDYEESLFLED